MINWVAPAVFVGLWATGFIGSRLSAPDAEPLSFLTIRFAIVAVILAVLSLVFSAKWPSPRDAFAALFIGMLTQGVYLGGVFWAIYYGMPAGVAALIAALQPLLTAAISGPLVGETAKARQWGGLALGIAGVGLVVWPKLEFGAEGITPATVFACFLSTVAITFGAVLQKRYLAEVDLRTSNTIQFIGGLVVVLVGALVSEGFVISWTGEVVFAMGWLVLVLSLGALTLLYWMIRRGDVSKVASLFFLVPAVTAVIAWAMFGDSLTLIQMAGMAVTAVAVLLVRSS